MPTFLRVVKDIPKTASGIVAKKNLALSFFAKEAHADVQRVAFKSKGNARL
jgi:tripartite-type tricarboxylate transporter receptor subunit TctC